ncbi:MAG: glycosyltransferase [Desulfocapsaceae bacterium]|nr:glycosyltransferase [Desulfocapsaceae bacterium]
MFDRDYYLLTNPDLTKWTLIPLVHYLRTGWREGRRPNPFFDPLFYIRNYPESAAGKEEPLYHYIREGWRKGYLPSCQFSPDYYLQQAPPITEKVNPLAHYLGQGHRDGRKPSLYFDPDYYLRTCPDAAKSGMSPFHHYVTIGIKEKRSPSPFFDVAWYLDRTPALRTMSVDPVAHYMEFGAVEGKSPIPLFDPLYYREQYSDLEKDEELYTHYLTVGLADDRRPSKWFDPAFYRSAYPDCLGEGLSPLEHYLEKGIYEQRYPDARVQNLLRKPLISIVVPVYNVEAHYLNNCIRSVVYQAYPHWELCLADDCSSQPHIRQLLEQWAAKDKRIKATFLETNQGISKATNAAASLASGEYIAFLDNDDELTVDCLYQVVKVIGETRADLLYSDEDLIGADGRRFSVFYKPGFNPELLLSHNYITHLMISRRTLFDAVGGLNAKYDGAQDYDLVLKLSEQAQQIVHLPQVLYHWRASETSTSINHEQKSYADEAGRNAVVAAMERRCIDAEVQATDWKFYYRVQRKLCSRPFVSILVYWKDDPADASAWLRSLLDSTAYDQFEILLMMSAAADREGAYCQAVTEVGANIICLPVEEGLGRAALYNLAVGQSRGEYLVFFDCEVTVRSADWLELLLAQAQEKGIGAVACGMHATKGGEQEIETLPDISNDSSCYYLNFLQQCSVHMNGLQWLQNVLAVPWELCLVSKELFESCDGFDESNFPSLFWGVDFCLRLREQGQENIYIPPYGVAELPAKKDDNSAVRGEMKEWGEERRRFQARWQKLLLQGDPYYNLGVLDNRHIAVDQFLKWYANAGQEGPEALSS